ncbi:hypothetical protein Dimus_033354, partial [Dionaea muscipula]
GDLMHSSLVKQKREREMVVMALGLGSVDLGDEATAMVGSSCSPRWYSAPGSWLAKERNEGEDEKVRWSLSLMVLMMESG